MKLSLLTEDSYAKHVGLFIPLPRELAKQYPPKQEDKSDPHITVLYIGEASIDELDLIEKVSRKVLSKYRPLEIFIGGLAWFDSNEDGQVAHSMVEAKNLHTIHKHLWDELEKAGIEVDHAYPEYTPHVTLSYAGNKRQYDGPVPEGSWECNTIELWKGKGEKVASFRLGAD